MNISVATPRTQEDIPFAGTRHFLRHYEAGFGKAVHAVRPNAMKAPVESRGPATSANHQQLRPTRKGSQSFCDSTKSVWRTLAAKSYGVPRVYLHRLIRRTPRSRGRSSLESFSRLRGVLGHPDLGACGQGGRIAHVAFVAGPFCFPEVRQLKGRATAAGRRISGSPDNPDCPCCRNWRYPVEPCSSQDRSTP